MNNNALINLFKPLIKTVSCTDEVMTIPSMSKTNIDKVYELEEITSKLKQIDLKITQVIHAGIYCRTAFMPAGTLLTGALIKLDTILIVSGDVTVYIGDETKRLTGYNTFKASSNRKQAFYSHTDTYLTMMFATNADSFEDAEMEFTDEFKKLTTRRT